ncbi:glycogen synthase [Robiginitalea aurantiaca]|uniref:starch synthase n=1 Tax=Robiginitalea aurantiaca TaxID=3056915 RepID=A0ABT7WDQ3_9FLAO|nr:glycogen/starch synthase [Robiginitalea aurantiaca]MDM9631053.1 glycogen/starch synthase [Robiginitalea aurantiaca]
MPSNFLFVAAENDAILDCKAGGMGDVVRDVPRAIAERGDQVSIVVPSYSRLHQKGEYIGAVAFLFAGTSYEAELYKVKPKKEFPGIVHYVLHHPEITAGQIAHMYHHDPEEPFYNDAIKFAIFCTGVAGAIQESRFGNPDVIHLHDWHTSLLLFLREFHPDYNALKAIRFVYSIHNLAIQGIRPLRDNPSSLQAWFPDCSYELGALQDPRYTDCINLMALGIRKADAVHTVSPSYMEDILKPSKPPEFIGGEGLEKDLVAARNENRLFGILNGCNYKNIRTATTGKLFTNTISEIFRWLQMEDKKYKADFLAHTGEKVLRLMESPPAMICASVARLTEQKFYFFKNDPHSLEEILSVLQEVNGIYMLLGTGAPDYEEFFREVSYAYPNFIFTNAQSEDLIDSMYLEADLYLMPSLFEPCGISQMLAMRNGNPCFAHATGGLKDTIRHMETGFLFEGESYEEKITAIGRTFKEVTDLFLNEQERWQKIKKAAAKERFTWSSSVEEYYKELYQL